MKIGIIIQREYLTRVKKRSFILITFLAPIFFAALMFLPALLMLNSEKFDTKKTIAVCDESTLFIGKFKDTDVNTFMYVDNDIATAKNLVREGVYDGVLYIPGTSLTLPVNAEIYSMNQIPMTLSDYINTTMKKVIEHQKLLASGIDPEIVKAANTTIHVQSIRMSEDENVEKKSFGEFEFLLGIALAMVIYFVIFIFGSQVMRGVIEEKTNRIIEVIISSVKPFELMMGKIIGIALVGLTQFHSASFDKSLRRHTFHQFQGHFMVFPILFHRRIFPLFGHVRRCWLGCRQRDRHPAVCDAYFDASDHPNGVFDHHRQRA